LALHFGRLPSAKAPVQPLTAGGYPYSSPRRGRSTLSIDVRAFLSALISMVSKLDPPRFRTRSWLVRRIGHVPMEGQLYPKGNAAVSKRIIMIFSLSALPLRTLRKSSH
jgi:hypothetical protein